MSGSVIIFLGLFVETYLLCQFIMQSSTPPPGGSGSFAAAAQNANPTENAQQPTQTTRFGRTTTASDWADQTDADEKLGRSDKRGFYRTTMRRIHGCLSTLEQAGVDHHALKTALYLIEAMEGGYGIGQSDATNKAQQSTRPPTVQANPLF